MKRILSSLSILTLGLAMSAFAYGKTPSTTCCQDQSACCDKSASCCDQAKCCEEASCCQKSPKPACCDGAMPAAAQKR